MIKNNLITSDGVMVFCSRCHRPVGTVENKDFIGSVLCSDCFGMSCISKDELKHALDNFFDFMRIISE